MTFKRYKCYELKCTKDAECYFRLPLGDKEDYYAACIDHSAEFWDVVSEFSPECKEINEAEYEVGLIMEM